MVALGYLPQNFGRWPVPTNSTLSFYGWKLSGGDTLEVAWTLEPLTAVIEFI